jgi:hypothetical protein
VDVEDPSQLRFGEPDVVHQESDDASQMAAPNGTRQLRRTLWRGPALFDFQAAAAASKAPALVRRRDLEKDTVRNFQILQEVFDVLWCKILDNGTYSIREVPVMFVLFL